MSLWPSLYKSWIIGVAYMLLLTSVIHIKAKLASQLPLTKISSLQQREPKLIRMTRTLLEKQQQVKAHQVDKVDTYVDVPTGSSSIALLCRNLLLRTSI